MADYLPKENLEEKILNKDKVFAKTLTFPHLIYVFIYSIWIVGWMQPEHPRAALHLLFGWNPYSVLFFPPIVAILYCFVFWERFRKYRSWLIDEKDEDDKKAAINAWGAIGLMSRNRSSDIEAAVDAGQQS